MWRNKCQSMHETDYYENIENVITNFKKELECPVCLDVVKIPFRLCARGHVICVGCQTTLTACPTCKGRFVAENPVTLKNILEKLPYNCRYSGNGCDESLLFRSRDNHEAFCGYRPIKCRLGMCAQEIPAVHLVHHYKTEHPNILVLAKEKVQSMYYSRFDPLQARQFHNLVSVFGELYWLTLMNCVREKQLRIMFEAIPIGALKRDCCVKLSIKNGEYAFTSTVKAHIPPAPREMGREPSGGSPRVPRNLNYMAVHQVMLPHLIHNDGALWLKDICFFRD